MKKKTLMAFSFMLFVTVQCRSQERDPATGAYVLKPSPKTVVWGYYSASAAPVMRVKSGDTVQVQTLITSSPERLATSSTEASGPCIRKLSSTSSLVSTEGSTRPASTLGLGTRCSDAAGAPTSTTI